MVNRKWPQIIAAFVIGLASASIASTSDESDPVTVIVSEPSVAPVLAAEAPAQTDFFFSAEPIADLAEQVLPTVVQLQHSRGLGSGVLYDAEQGRIFTAAHVVAGARNLTVRLFDGREVAGEVLAIDEANDLAIIGISSPGLIDAPLGEIDSVRVGQFALAVGSPLGFEQTVTSGIVSATNRELHVSGARLEGLIQTDAAINPGNSGGPLLNRSGEVIGINTAIASSGGGSEGLGFAVPIDRAIVLDEALTARLRALTTT